MRKDAAARISRKGTGAALRQRWVAVIIRSMPLQGTSSNPSSLFPAGDDNLTPCPALPSTASIRPSIDDIARMTSLVWYWGACCRCRLPMPRAFPPMAMESRTVTFTVLLPGADSATAVPEGINQTRARNAATATVTFMPCHRYCLRLLISTRPMSKPHRRAWHPGGGIYKAHSPGMSKQMSCRVTRQRCQWQLSASAAGLSSPGEDP